MIKQVISILFLVSLCSVAHPMNKRRLDTDRGAHRAKRTDTGQNVQRKLFDVCRDGYRGTDDERLKDIERLVALGADIDARDENQYTPFHVLLDCNKNISEYFVGEFLEKYGDKIDSDFRLRIGWNYLHTALDKKVTYPAIRKIIQKFPYLVDQPNSNGSVPFIFALRKRSSDTCNDMLKDINLNFIDSQGSRYLHHAVRLERPKVVDYLAKNCPEMIGCQNNKGETPLHWAVGERSGLKHMVPIVRSLVECGADCFIQNEANRCFLERALRRPKYQEILECLENYHDANLRDICLMDRRGEDNLKIVSSSIFFFNELKPQEIVERIKYLGGKGFVFSADHLTLAVSEYKQPKLVIKKLLDLGIGINDRDSRNFSVLDILAIKNKHSVLPIVLELGANLFAVDEFDENCLFAASSSGHYEFIEKVFRSLKSDEERKRLVNTQNTKAGRTPLFTALRAHDAMYHKKDRRKSLNTGQVVEVWIRLLPYANLTLRAKERSRVNLSNALTISETLERCKNQLPAYDYQRLQKTLESQDQLKKLKNVE